MKLRTELIIVTLSIILEISHKPMMVKPLRSMLLCSQKI
mgnify:CR=1 FL=1